MRPRRATIDKMFAGLAALLVGCGVGVLATLTAYAILWAAIHVGLFILGSVTP